MAVPTPTHTDGQTRNITNVNRDAAPVAIKISVRCRLSEAVNTTASAELTIAVGKENLLLQTYDIFLPPPHQRAAWLVPGNRDIVGSRILQTFYPSLVQHAVPLAVQGDGNCLFRAVSRLLYGKENMHKLLRLDGPGDRQFSTVLRSVRRTICQSGWQCSNTIARLHGHSADSMYTWCLI